MTYIYLLLVGRNQLSRHFGVRAQTQNQKYYLTRLLLKYVHRVYSIYESCLYWKKGIKSALMQSWWKSLRQEMQGQDIGH